MRKIIIVDEEKDFYNTFAFRNKFSIDFYEKAEPSLSALKKHPYDLMVCESHFKDMDCLQLIEKTLSFCPHLPIIFLTGEGSYDLAVKVLQTGVKVILSKPITMVELIQAIENLLQKSSNETIKRNINEPTANEEIDAFINRNLFRKNLNELLLNEFNTSRSSLHRYLLRQFGKSFSAIVNEKKSILAQEQLANTNKSIKTIASELNFDNSYYFSNWFKKSSGESPLFYRNSITKKTEHTKIGVLVDLSGYYPYGGYDLLKGVRYFNDRLENMNEPYFDLIPIDTATSTSIAEHRIGAAQRSGISHFIGCNRANITFTAAQKLNHSKALFLTGSCLNMQNYKFSNVFQWSIPIYNAMFNTVTPFNAKHPLKKRWFTIAPDYIFGHTLLDCIDTVFKQLNIEHIGAELHPIGYCDFARYFKKALNDKSEVIVLLNYGFDTIQALQEAISMKINEEIPIIIPWSSGLSLLEQFSNKELSNIFIGSLYWHNTPLQANKTFVNSWFERFSEFPNSEQVTGYQLLRILALGKNQQNNSLKNDLRPSLEKLRWPGFTEKEEYFLQTDHYANKGYFLVEAAKMNNII